VTFEMSRGVCGPNPVQISAALTLPAATIVKTIIATVAVAV
jgi:hypothetical protein